MLIIFTKGFAKGYCYVCGIGITCYTVIKML
jgi:hypothetical protein